jgi:hypothetical protein
MRTRKWTAGIGLLAMSMGVAAAVAQEDQDASLPKTPTSFETRNTGDSEEGEVTIKKEEAKPTKVTFTAVTDSRDWKDTTGKVIRGRLLAFEAAEGEVAELVRDGKVRLLVDGAKRFSLLPLEKLSTEDRTHIGLLAAARKKQASQERAAP